MRRNVFQPDAFAAVSHHVAQRAAAALLTDALLKGGIPLRVVGKILRGNVMRVLAEA